MKESDKDEEVSGFGQLWELVSEAVRRGVVGFFRQSTLTQARRNLGSQKVQEEQIRYVRPFGLTEDKVRIILAYGESGRPGVVRERFRLLMREVRAGRVGMILLARHDRLGRNSKESAELFDEMKARDVLIMVDGRVYDPNDESDEFILGIYAQFAEHENRARTRWLGLTRFARARDRQLAINLPTPLVWADPTDPRYVEALEAEGMGAWLRDLSPHTVGARIDGRIHRILPFPDARMERCTRLLASWLLETGSTTQVAYRVEEGHDGWPRPGFLPSRQRSRWTPDLELRWTPVLPSSVAAYLRSPALYGTYQFRAPSLAPRRNRRLSDVTHG